MPRIRGALALCCLFGLLLIGGCARCASKLDFESFVSVPTELDAVEELDDPPDVVVKVEKKAVHKGGGGGCGHSPICIIIIPFVLADALFPEKLRVATVTERGRETYHGVFRENGQFVQALAFQDGVWKKLALVQLPELGRNVVVEVERAPPDAEGKPGKFERSSLQKQVDLLTGYRSALGQAGDGEKKRRLIREMLTHLHADALPLTRERLLDSGEGSGLKRDALELICSKKLPIGSAQERADLLKQLDATNPDVGVSIAALACFDATRPADAAAFTARVVDAACAEKDASRAEELTVKLLGWAEDKAALGSALEPFVARCAASERRMFLRFLFGFEVGKDELRALAGSKDPTTAGQVIRRLSNLDPVHRAILLEQLERPEAPAKALLLALGQNGKDPDAEEAKALAGAFIARGRDPELRAELLLRLGSTPEDQRAPAKQRLEQKLATASGEERAALAAGLVMLGDAEREATAAQALSGRCPELAEARSAPAPSASSAAAPSASSAPGPSPVERAESDCAKKLSQSYWQVRDTPGLVAFVLQHRGCSERELLDLASEKAKPAERGRLCKGAKG